VPGGDCFHPLAPGCVITRPTGIIMQPIITLTTDFGYQDHYVGVLKGVILRINPAATLVDITHAVPAHAITHAAFLLASSYSFFPAGTVHLAVVDPGVGTSRRPIVVDAGSHCFVGPDNGIFTFIYRKLATFTVYELSEPAFFLPVVSATFHGRDVFAPVAAHLSSGVPPFRLGQPIGDYCILTIPEPHRTRNILRGTILYVDGFSNLITNISARDLDMMGTPGQLRVRIRATIIKGISAHYQAVNVGEALAIVGSTDLLEISIREGKAGQILDAHEGDDVIVEI